MTDDVVSGFVSSATLTTSSGSRFPEKVNYLGKPGKIVDRLKQGESSRFIVAAFGPQRRDSPIIDYYENHLIPFFSVPNVRSLSEAAHVLRAPGQRARTLHPPEPLSFAENRFRKRVSDIAFSLLFLCTLFPLSGVIVGLDHQTFCQSNPLKRKAQGRRRTGIYAGKFAP